MKIIRYHEQGPPDVLRVENSPTPDPGAGEMLLRIEAAGIAYGQTMQRGGRHYPFPVTLPATPGASVAGVVEKVGPGDDAGLIGKRMFAMVATGGWAEYGVAPIAGSTVLPEGVSSVDAVAVLSDGATAGLILTLGGRLQPGESVFVPAAAGGLGFVAVQLARLFGAGRVFGGASSADKRQIVLDLGADAAMDYTQDGWSKTVLAANGNRGVDLALEMSGGPIFYETLEATVPGGRIVNYGNASDTECLVNPRLLLRRNLTLTGFLWGGYRDHRPAMLDQVLAFLAQGKLRAQYQKYALGEAPLAHAALEARQSLGRQILVPNAV